MAVVFTSSSSLSYFYFINVIRNILHCKLFLRAYSQRINVGNLLHLFIHSTIFIICLDYRDIAVSTNRQTFPHVYNSSCEKQILNRIKARCIDYWMANCGMVKNN